MTSLWVALCIAVWSCVHVSPMRRQFVVAPLAENALDFLYFAIAQRAGLEAWFCLRGYVDRASDNVFIQNISPVFVDSADGANIHGRPAGCRQGADSASVIGTVHFHPDMNECDFSDADIVTAHWLALPTTAIVCRDIIDTVPHLRLVYRAEVDSAYDALPKVGDGAVGGRRFTPIYRYAKRRPESP